MILRTIRRTDKAREATLYVDDAVWGTLPVGVLPSYCVPGLEISIGARQADELQKLLTVRANTILMDRLAAEEISTFKAGSILRAKRFRADIVQAVLERFSGLGYLSDARYAEVLIRSWIARGAGRHAIIAKLRAQRVPSSIWAPLLQELWDPAASAESLQALMQKYILAHRDLPRRKLKDRAFGYFIRRGFTLDEVASAWNSVDGED